MSVKPPLASAAGGSYNGVVNIAGTQNVVDGCSIGGGSAGGYCLVVSASAPSPAGPHLVTNSELKNCGNVAVYVDDQKNDIEFPQNVFKLNGSGIEWASNHTGASMTNNTFVADGGWDVVCSASSPGITGSGNLSGGGSIQCLGCANCPF